jgi:flagellin FlaB
MRKLVKNEEAFTGLEAAIVLIAFVVVAAVFSYVVLGAGFFTTEKSQEVVHAGVSSAASNIVVKGNVYGLSNDTDAGIETFQFDVGLAAGGMPIDMERTAMIFSTKDVTPYPLEFENGWNITAGNDDDNILQVGETFTIQAVPDDVVPARMEFVIEIKPEIGASLAIQRTVPPSITNTTILY